MIDHRRAWVTDADGGRFQLYCWVSLHHSSWLETSWPFPTIVVKFGLGWPHDWVLMSWQAVGLFHWPIAIWMKRVSWEEKWLSHEGVMTYIRRVQKCTSAIGVEQRFGSVRSQRKRFCRCNCCSVDQNVGCENTFGTGGWSSCNPTYCIAYPFVF